MTPIIEIKNLVKNYPGIKAVDDVSFVIEPGICFGLLGPNGAGKTTLIEIVEGVQRPDSGSTLYKGAPAGDRFRKEAGIQFQVTSLQEFLTVRETLRLFRNLYPRSLDMNDVVRLCSLEEFLDRDTRKLSGGQRQRLLMALALVNDPEVLFLDEPTTGLDPASRRDVWDEVRRLNQELGITIFLTTQYLEEADELADTVAIIDRGKIATEGSPARLKAALGRESINLLFDNRSLAEKAMAELRGMGDHLQLDRDVVRLYRSNAAEAIPAVVNRLQQAAVNPISLTLTQPTLDDVFLQVTGQRLQALETPLDKAA
jgi:ABC-2 type transport system ATP-binding protein